MRRFITVILLLTVVMSICGCSLYETEYVSIKDYTPAESSGSAGPDDKVTVRSLAELKRAVKSVAYSDSGSAQLVFDASYEGNPETDLTEVCRQLKAEDALCVYCEANFSYSIKQILNYYEAELNVSYLSPVNSPADIIHIPYSVNLEDYIIDAFNRNAERLVIMIDASSYSSTKMKSLVTQVFRENPTLCPVEPEINIYMYSGENYQRLYEININYMLSEDELIRRKSLIRNLDIEDNIQTADLDEIHTLIAACDYISANVSVTDDETLNTLYDAMINGSADSEGVSMAFVEICSRLGIECTIVYGQKDENDECWNIVKIDGNYYHIDVPDIMVNGRETVFLFSDDDMREEYRWDTSSYPACDNEFDITAYPDLIPEGYIVVSDDKVETGLSDEDAEVSESGAA